MPDSLMYQQEHFVVLEPNQPEQFLTPSELLEKLKTTLQQLQIQDLSPDLQKLDTVEGQAQYLLDTGCELDIAPGQYLKWYAVRLEK
ncbi:MAG: chlororespiratory reduction protein 7 [Nostoc sp.]|uniref:chlororespiratory reduction protein 7 n=1 Tax=Nostoc sp. TaxID=1180 RepID=UPI002FF6668F